MLFYTEIYKTASVMLEKDLVASCKFNCRTINSNFCYIASQYISFADLNLKIFLG